MPESLSIAIDPDPSVVITVGGDQIFLSELPRSLEALGIIEDEPIAIHSYSDMPIIRSAAGVGNSIELRQEVASSNWVFGHNLGRIPKVFITDLAGNVLLVQSRVTTTQVFVTIESPATGIAYLS